MDWVTVVIPTYNRSALIARAIDSVLNQTYTNIEIIVVDDGSTDNTESLVKSRYSKKIIYFRQQNGGAAAARVTGLGLSSSPFITFLDSDDYYLPTRIEMLLSFYNQNSFDFVTTDLYHEIDGKFTTTTQYAGPRNCSWHEDNQYSNALKRNFINYMVLMPTNLMREIGSYDVSLRYHEDWDLWLRLLKSGRKVGLLREALAVYRIHEGSLSTTRDLRKSYDNIKILSKHADSKDGMRALKVAYGSVQYNEMLRAARQRHHLRTLWHMMALARYPQYILRGIQSRTHP